MICVVSAEITHEYQVQLKFNDGFEGVLDFKQILTKDSRDKVKELLNLEIFNRLKIELDTVCWENGVDFAPDYLYEKIKKRRHVA